MNPWIRKTILALALVIVGMVGVAFWKPAYLFGAAAAIAPDLTAKMIVKWSLYRKELIAKSFSPEEQKKNLEEQTIRIELGGRKYDIPVRYAYGEAFEKRGYWPQVKPERVSAKAFGLSVLLPDLKPYYPEDDAHWKVLGHGRKIQIDLVIKEDPAWFSFYRKLYFSGNANYNKRVDDIYDLAYFSREGELDDVFMPLDESTELMLTCVEMENNTIPSPSCFVESNYRPGVVLRYYYSRKYLQNWRQIDTSLKAMFDHFEQAASAAEHVNTAK